MCEWLAAPQRRQKWCRNTVAACNCKLTRCLQAVTAVVDVAMGSRVSPECLDQLVAAFEYPLAPKEVAPARALSWRSARAPTAAALAAAFASVLVQALWDFPVIFAASCGSSMTCGRMETLARATL